MASYTPTTISGHTLAEVTSAFQKCVRRGLEDSALHWTFELVHSNFDKYIWKRILYIASEDVGLGEPFLQMQVQSLFTTWSYFKKEYASEKDGQTLFIIHAVYLLCRARKSRLLDDLLWSRQDRWKNEREDKKIPKFAYDMFTAKGKELGRDVRHFFEHSAKLHPHNTDVPGTEEMAKEVQELLDFMDDNGGKLPSVVAGKKLPSPKTAPPPESLKKKPSPQGTLDID